MEDSTIQQTNILPEIFSNSTFIMFYGSSILDLEIRDTVLSVLLIVLMPVQRVWYYLIKKIKDPLFLIALFLSFFWFADTWYKIFIQHAPTRMLWWSSAGLGLTIIGLVTRNIFLTCSLFCMLFVSEFLWTVSFILNILHINDNISFAKYAFGKDYPRIGFLIALFHLFIIPALIVALFRLRKTSRFGWLGAYLIGLSVAFLAYFFPDFNEDVNCIRGATEACRLYFKDFYSLPPAFRIFAAASAQLVIFYIPLNILLVIIRKNETSTYLKRIIRKNSHIK